MAVAIRGQTKSLIRKLFSRRRWVFVSKLLNYRDGGLMPNFSAIKVVAVEPDNEVGRRTLAWLLQREIFGCSTLERDSKQYKGKLLSGTANILGFVLPNLVSNYYCQNISHQSIF